MRARAERFGLKYEEPKPAKSASKAEKQPQSQGKGKQGGAAAPQSGGKAKAASPGPAAAASPAPAPRPALSAEEVARLEARAKRFGTVVPEAEKLLVSRPLCRLQRAAFE